MEEQTSYGVIFTTVRILVLDSTESRHALTTEPSWDLQNYSRRSTTTAVTHTPDPRDGRLSRAAGRMARVALPK